MNRREFLIAGAASPTARADPPFVIATVALLTTSMSLLTATGGPSGITYTVQVTVEQNGYTATANLPATATSPGEFFCIAQRYSGFSTLA